jgi:hypothetical protein
MLHRYVGLIGRSRYYNTWLQVVLPQDKTGKGAHTSKLVGSLVKTPSPIHVLSGFLSDLLFQLSPLITESNTPAISLATTVFVR